MAQGHPEARFYPIGMLATEVDIARKRENGKLASEISLMQLAMGSVLSKKSGSALKKELENLSADAE